MTDVILSLTPSGHQHQPAPKRDFGVGNYGKWDGNV